ncbi:mitogen-activated protein kinase kinase kinase YODA-like isoform X2 [Magnolia sinica]|uniref:mitogen-activated protein kinase kinase kinase YODA-like isoform X2 n=1 Tax=Magnolia sinica TaxID=86752 RepID=UPI00265A202E|nr:mitogen-activated protein kinase kinase kinase YODA-like isoform X2 [Magnolia sinica]
MPSWWGKSSSKEVKKKTSKENFIDTLHRKFKSPSEEKGSVRPGGSRRHSNDIGVASEKGSLSRAESRSSSPSKQVSRCLSFAERPHAQPLPLPGAHPANIARTASGISISRPALEKRVKPTLFLPLPKRDHSLNRPDATDIDGDLATASLSSDCSNDSDDPVDPRLVSTQGNDYEIGRTVANSHSSVLHKDQYPNITRKNSGEILKPANLLFNNQSLSSSPKRGHTSNLPQYGAFGIGSAPDSSMSSPSRSPMRAVCPEQIASSAFWASKPYPDVALLGSGQCSSPGSGHNSGHNSMGGDMSGQLFWQHSRGSPECSPIPSPRMTSPGPSSRIQSGAVTPLHPRAGGATPESPTSWADDGKQQSHRLPLPPLTICNTSPFSPSNSGVTSSSSVPRSPGRAENPTSPGSRWKKGKLIGRGTFGHVYVGFNSESGEMCAMKEVTLFSDDAKSKESAKQLMQEIALLSRLRHQNIVQYYGSETIDDKLYIYLEYVSGGSIHKLLQEYGQFGELAIRSYTQQILSGLAYLHAKNTVHRDIKGANILVDPNGRVKLADFGMAKHITGQSCPLSLKGSPYWMAPEVIKNSNGCNLAVDIWSLGCTVLEMATTKPPWSQYEGVAAMFKIGNSKELPAIPDHLSDDGKDFVKQCLQRNPLHRPTAAKLLEHRFVKNAATVEKPIISQLLEPPTGVANGIMRSTGTGHARNHSSLDMEGLALHQLSLDMDGLAIHQLRGARTHSSTRRDSFQ